MSDSEDDFMSDKFLVEAPVASTTTYSQRRERAVLHGRERQRANEALPLAQREVERRREGLQTSLFEREQDSGQAKAMGLMMKMGWKVGEGLGKRDENDRRSASPERGPSVTKVDRGRESRPGIGAGKPGSAGAAKGGIGAGVRAGESPRVWTGKAEPIRLSMWAGRKGLTARSPSPPPLRRGRGDLPPDRLAQLAAKADTYRGARGQELAQRETERKEAKAREILVDLDAAKGVKFHPLHAMPSNPDILPRPMLQRLYPDLSPSRSPSPALVAEPDTSRTLSSRLLPAEKLREQMRREMLSELGGEEDGVVKFGIPPKEADKPSTPAEENADDGQEPDWDEMVSGTKRVLAMSPAEHLAYLVSQLRHEHLFCFWCASKYSSWEEMDGPGGCPGEDEDDH